MFSKTSKISASAVIVAAGSSRRMGESVNKQFLFIDDIPVLAHTLLKFSKAKLVDEIIVITKADSILLVQDLIKEFGIKKVKEIMPGGETRQDSVCLGLERVPHDKLVAIHDGARPFVSSEKIDELIEAAQRLGAVVPGIIPKDTVKAVSEDYNVTETPDRNTLRLIQTPQIFKAAALKLAYAHAYETGFIGTDDSSVAENAGMTVHIIDGEYTNIKVTTPEDLYTANGIYEYLKNN